MVKIYDKIKLLLKRNSENEIFENKIFNIISFVGAGICFLSFIPIIYNNSYSMTNLIGGSLGILFSVFFYLSFFRGITKPLIIPFHILVALGLTLNWFSFQGIQGSTALFFLPAMFLLIYSNQNNKHLPLLIGYVSLAIVLVALHYVFPEWEAPYANENFRILDLSFCFIIVLSVLGYAAIVLKKNFDTERSKTQQKNKELETSEARLKRAEIASKTGNWELHIDSQTIIASEGAMKVYGIDKAQFDYQVIKDIPLTEFRPLLDAALKNLLKLDKPYDVEYKIKAVDTGELKDIHSIAVFDKEKRIIFGIIQDITERKLSEEAFRDSQSHLSNALNIALLGPWEYDVENDLFTFNDSFFAVFRTTAKEVGGYTMSSLDYASRFVHPEDILLVGLETKRAIETNDPDFSRQLEHRILYADGEIGYIKVRFSIIKDEKGRTKKTYGINQDITEQIRNEKILKESEALLRELNATKDKFFSIISHDLKNPFNAIIGFSNILTEQVQEKNYEGIGEYASIIHNSSQRAMDLLTNLLEWSRSQSGRMEFAPKTIEIVELINEVSELVNDAAQQKSITILRALPEKSTVFADRAMISTVLRNLISNAIKFTNLGGEIAISAEQKPDELWISVSDNGVGIKEDAIEYLFRIDKSYSTAGTQNEEGTGLGLILCKEFVEKHGGKIWVESEVNKGSKFWFTIPMS